MVKSGPKIQDVARVAGVSAATVSRTLSNPSIVSEETRNAVLNAIQSTGYKTNRAARNLRTQRAGVVAVVLTTLQNPFFPVVIDAASSVFAGTDFNVLILDSALIKAHQVSPQSYLSEGHADGLIFVDSRMAETEHAYWEPEAPIVFACDWDKNDRFPSVQCDDGPAIKLGMQHLYDLGHRNIAHLAGPSDSHISRVRSEAFLAFCRENGLSTPHLLHGDFSMISGADAADRLLELSPRPTAISCSCDLSALGLISGLTQRGIRVPEDVSVIGFDDLQMCKFSVPRLTTLRQERQLIGRRAAELLLERIMDPTEAVIRRHAGLREIVPVSLVERDSTEPPKA